jgi:hypothetical protein
MADFSVRSDSVNVEQIMEQIRARIREKRGVDYTEQQIRELAAVKLEKFLDPRGVRSDLLEQFRRQQPRYEPPVVPSFTFEDTTMYETHRGVLRFFRKLLNPILKLFFNPNAIIHALHAQAEINRANLEREVSRENQRRDIDALYFEVIHNLVIEVTRSGIELKNLKMRVESLAGRLEFNERRARALESVVAYKPGEGDIVERQSAAVESTREASGAGREGARQPVEARPEGEGPGQRSRRRRRRRGRRGGTPATAIMSGASATSQAAVADPAESVDHDTGAEQKQEMSGAAEPVRDDLDQFTGADAHPSEPVPAIPEQRRPQDNSRPPDDSSSQ